MGGEVFTSIRGQTLAKRALEIAAAGGHNILIKGPPGTGKTLLAEAFASLLPPLSEKELLRDTPTLRTPDRTSCVLLPLFFLAGKC